MGKLEKEVKILDINVGEVKNKLEQIGSKYNGEKKQKIYVYDIPALYYRYLEIKELLKSDNKLIVETSINKLKMLIMEFTDLVDDKQLNELLKELNLNNIDDLFALSVEEIINKLNNELFDNLFKKLMINPNKWVRLRQSNDKVELTVKHVFDKNTSTIQKVLENEIEVSSLEDANKILESIGIYKRSYQEKIRFSYSYKGADIEIDIWPKLNPYLEIECEDEEVIKEIIELLELNDKEIVSINTEKLYERIGLKIHEISELKF